MRFIALTLLAVFLLVPPAIAENMIYKNNKADIERIEQYLNGVKTMQADFLQTTSAGNVAEGKVYISRPNKMRFTYNPPAKILLVADGDQAVFYDGSVEQVSYLPLSSTPLSAILADRVDLDNPSITLVRFVKSAGEMSLTFIQRKDPGAGEITLQFSQEPFALRRWVVRDAQDVLTTVALLNPEFGQSFDPKLFKFEDPRPLSKRIDQ